MRKSTRQFMSVYDSDLHMNSCETLSYKVCVREATSTILEKQHKEMALEAPGSRACQLIPKRPSGRSCYQFETITIMYSCLMYVNRRNTDLMLCWNDRYPQIRQKKINIINRRALLRVLSTRNSGQKFIKSPKAHFLRFLYMDCFSSKTVRV